MAISRQKKKEIVEVLEKRFSNYTLVVFVDYKGLGVQNFEKVRNELRKEGFGIKVAKKTLLNLVLNKLKIPMDCTTLDGQIAVVFGYGDALMLAKIIHNFTKKFETLKILAGLLGKEVVGSEQIIALAELPSYQDLLARVVRSVQAPLSGLVNVLQGNIRGLAQVLSAISKK